MDKFKRIEYLVKQLNLASDAYYSGKDEIMSNYEWDSMFDELTQLEQETGYILSDSPTQNVSRSKDDDGDQSGLKEAHEFPALSLAKTKKVDELITWASGKDVWISWKLDGITLVATYDDGKLTRLLTRGNGTIGNNITYFKDAIKGIPSKIDYKGHMVVRGEAIISYKDFELINDLNDNGEKYANPRNLAAGTLALDPIREEIVKSRNVSFNAFSLIYLEDEIISFGDRMAFLDKLGFITVERERTNPEGIERVVSKFSKLVEEGNINYPVDGLVVSYDDTIYASGGSVTGHHATRAGLAFKWQDEVATTTLNYIEWSCATSVITPIAVFEPVKLEGTIVSRASLCNISELERLGIGENGKTKIHIIKANKIIPKCVGVVSKEGTFKVPTECPVCGERTHISENEVSGTKVLQCSNKECPAKNLSRFVRFVSKPGLDIDGLSIKTISNFINRGFISKFPDIFELSKYANIIANIEGFGEKSVGNLIAAIENSKKVNPINFIFSLSIPLIGTDTAKKIINKIGYEEFVRRSKNKVGFEDVPGIGIEKSMAILQWFNEQKNIEMFDILNNILEIEEIKKEDISQNCEGLTFVITGSLYTYKNRNELVKYIEDRGGQVSSAVSNKTSYLINNDSTSKSSKNLKANQLGVKIITENEFNELFK